jgi:hypothetical protein
MEWTKQEDHEDGFKRAVEKGYFPGFKPCNPALKILTVGVF